MDGEKKPGRQRPPLDIELGRLADRFRIAIGTASLRSIAKDSGVSEGTLRGILDGAMPRIDNLARICEATGYKLEWMATGSGPMRGVETQSDVAGIQFSMVPRYEVEASAGGGAIVERESDIGRVAFRKDWLKQKGLDIRELAVIRVIGDSMEPTIKDGALVLVDTREQPPRSDGIYILQNDGHLLAKRVQVDFVGGGITILSDNPSYGPIKVKKDELESIRIVGRVVWAGQEV